MGLEKDTLHVVIRLPFKRPKGFIEPPSIVWTDEMDHKLWQYMSQKNTDWNYIAEQLGVPTSYLVRHAAFIYETQLRGIQQQLRLNGSRNTKSPVQTTSSSKPTSVRYSNTFQQEEPKRNRDDSMILSNLSNISPRIPERELISSHNSNKQEIPMNNTVYKSFSSQHSREKQPEEPNNRIVQEEEEEEGNLSEDTRSEIGEEQEDLNSDQSKNEDDVDLEEYLKDRDDSKDEDESKGDEEEEEEEEEERDEEEEDEEEEDEEEEFSSHFERMKLQMEEPAFLPRKLDQSQRLSLSMQPLKREHTPTQGSPAVQPVTPSSTLNSVGSSFSDLSDSSITQSALEDAYMSKFNQGSKMSIFNLSRKYN